MTIQCDVVIVGGGPAGCAAAIALHRAGVENILVIESSQYESPRIGESIPPDTRGLFKQLGVLDAFEKEKHESCLGSHSCWGTNDLGYNDFLFNPRGSGWHLDRKRFDRFMVSQVMGKGIPFLMKSTVRQIQSESKYFPFSLTLDKGKTIQSRFVVDATGPGAKLSRRLGAVRKVEDTLIFIAGFFDFNGDAQELLVNNMTLLEAVEYGWWYAARLPNNRLIVAVASDKEIIINKQLQGLEGWRQALADTQYISKHLTHLTPTSLTNRVAPSSLLKPAGRKWLACCW